MDIQKYINQFSHLSVKIENGEKKPNKAIMLLSVIDLIRCNYIVDNKIYITPALEATFLRNWSLYVNHYKPSCWIPFWHLKNESFWHFKPIISLAFINTLAKPGETASLGRMKSAIQYAYLDEELYQMLKIKDTRDLLVSTLLTSYLIK